jgi:microcystin degradation protein MlrC
MRVVVALMRHETNTFSPLPTPIKDFDRRGPTGGPVTGQAAIDTYRDTNSPAAAFIDMAAEVGAEIDFAIAANASPSGPVARDAYETIAEAIVAAVEKGCDAAFLDLHGAMVTEHLDDGEGELLRRIRAVAPDLPIAVALDFHTNLSAAMIDNATVITGYRTYPHIDMYETGFRAGRTLLKALKGEAQPVTVWRSLPMLTHMLRQTPSGQPMKNIMDLAIAAETDGRVLNASVFGGFPLADIPHVGLSAIVVGDGDAAPAEALLDELLAMAWERRADFVFEGEPLEASIAHAKDLDGGPIVLADHGDNCGAGGCQDNMTVLAELIRQGLEDVAAGPICDAQSVDRMIEAGIGAEVTLSLGGKMDTPAMGLKGEPLQVTGKVTNITDGTFTVTGPMSTGSVLNMGRTAILDTGTMEIVVSAGRNEPFDVGCFTHAGIDPAKKRYVLVKSRQHFRAGFESIAEHIVLVAGPGVCASDYDLFPFKNLRRPIYPLDPDIGPWA